MAGTNGVFRQEMRRVPPGEFVRPNRKTNGSGVQSEDTRICVVMVGLPARGKSLIATKGEFPGVWRLRRLGSRGSPAPLVSGVGEALGVA